MCESKIKNILWENWAGCKNDGSWSRKSKLSNNRGHKKVRTQQPDTMAKTFDCLLKKTKLLTFLSTKRHFLQCSRWWCNYFMKKRKKLLRNLSYSLEAMDFQALANWKLLPKLSWKFSFAVGLVLFFSNQFEMVRFFVFFHSLDLFWS